MDGNGPEASLGKRAARRRWPAGGKRVFILVVALAAALEFSASNSCAQDVFSAGSGSAETGASRL